MKTDRNHSISYIPSLDGIRGLSILLVLLYHARAPGFSGGLIGVDLFFVLSGYLITTILISEQKDKGTISLGRFYLRRILRICPALYTFVFVGLMIIAVLNPDNFRTQLPGAFYLISFIYNWAIVLHSFTKETLLALHCWSLAIEMQYYLLWPFILGFLLKGRRLRTIKWTLIGLVLLSFLLRICVAIKGGGIQRIYFSTDLRLDGFLLGGLLAFLRGSELWKNYAKIFNKTLLMYSMIGFVLLISMYNFESIDSQVSAPLLAAVLSFILIGFVLEHPESKFTKMISVGWLLWLGKLSYSLYIWHYPFFRIMRENYAWPVTLVVGSILSLMCACLSYYFIELPFLRKKGKFSS